MLTQISIDEEETFEMFLSIAEYNAAFMNGEGVKAARQARLNESGSGGRLARNDDETFLESVKEMFGRPLDLSAPPVPTAGKTTNNHVMTEKDLRDISIIRRKKS